VATLISTETNNKNELQKQIDTLSLEKTAVESKLSDEVVLTKKLTSERDSLSKNLQDEKEVITE
jgi:hypothetical protein